MKGGMGMAISYGSMHVLGDPEVTVNIYCISRNLPNTDTQIIVQICGNFWVTQYPPVPFGRQLPKLDHN